MSAPVTVTLSRDWLAINAAKVARECSEAHITFLILDAKQDIAALTLARQQAASASNAQIAELREALAWYADQMCEGLCLGKDPQACANIGADNCSGCPAVVALAKSSSDGEGV